MGEPNRSSGGGINPFGSPSFDWYKALPDEYYLESFNTELSEAGEAAFQKWILEKSDEAGFELIPHDYDYRGAWKAGVAPGKGEHWPDTWKKPNHPTFSDESVYHDTPFAWGDRRWEGGHWEGEEFTPSEWQKGTTLSAPKPAHRSSPEPYFAHESASSTPRGGEQQRNRYMLGSLGMLEPLAAMKDPRITSRSPQSYELEYMKQRATARRAREDSLTRNPFNPGVGGR